LRSIHRKSGDMWSCDWVIILCIDLKNWEFFNKKEGEPVILSLYHKLIKHQLTRSNISRYKQTITIKIPGSSHVNHPHFRAIFMRAQFIFSYFSVKKVRFKITQFTYSLTSTFRFLYSPTTNDFFNYLVNYPTNRYPKGRAFLRPASVSLQVQATRKAVLVYFVQ